jgi:prokaryotic glutathione synthetase, ATP-grasp domain
MNNNMPVLGFFRERNDTEEFKFKAPFYQQAYHELLEMLEQRGIYVAVLMGQSSYLGQGRFAKHWVQVKRDGQWVFEKRGPITPNIVWVKDQFVADDASQINSAQFRQVCSDKNLSYDLLQQFQPRSLVVNNQAELERAVADLPGKMAVVKTPTGNSGLGVFVGLKQDFNYAEFNKPFPLQVQEFIETEGGIPGIVEGRHDFRVVTMNGEAIVATLRTPPQDGFKSNIGYGGFTRLVDVSEIPADLKELVAQIDAKLATISTERFYSADFGLTSQGWRLFEVNAMPGTLNRERGEPAVYYQQKLVEFLASVTERAMVKAIPSQRVIGRSERIDLIDFNLNNLPAKIDTGAYSSSIDHSQAKLVERDGRQVLEFILLRPERPGYTGELLTTEQFEMTEVKNSNGCETRFVIFADIKVGDFVKKCRLTLANRADLRYPVLIGRRFLREANMLVDVNKGQGLPDDEEERRI